MEEQKERELGIEMVLLEQFEHKTLPDALWIKGKVDNGECLSEGDIECLEEILERATEIKGLIDARPDLQSLYARAVDLYEDITAKALENEQTTVAKETNAQEKESD